MLDVGPETRLFEFWESTMRKKRPHYAPQFRRPDSRLGPARTGSYEAGLHRIVLSLGTSDGHQRSSANDDELVDERARQPHNLDPRRCVLQPAHGRLRSQRCAGLGRTADGELQQRIMAQTVEIVGILVAAADRKRAS